MASLSTRKVQFLTFLGKAYEAACDFPGREGAMVRTKIDEARLWSGEVCGEKEPEPEPKQEPEQEDIERLKGLIYPSALIEPEEKEVDESPAEV